MLRKKYKKDTKTPTFIKKLNNMLQNPQSNPMISWAQEQNSFVVRQPALFSTTLLPKYFKHKNYSSFIRQLNLYNFTKLRSENDGLHLFKHPLFKRGEVEKHSLIRRREQMNFIEGNYPEPENNQSQTPKQKQKLSTRIKSLNRSQSELMQKCTRLISENDQIMDQNFILKATIGDDTINHRIIMETISNFIIHYATQDGGLSCYDSHSITNLLQFLDRNNQEDSLWTGKRATAFRSFLRVVQNNDARNILGWINSAIGSDKKKKKNYTIIGHQRLECEYEDNMSYVQFLTLQNAAQAQDD